MSSIDPRRSGMPPFFQTLYANLTSLIQYIITAVIPQYVGTAHFVCPNGNNTTGLTWATAYHSIAAAMADCQQGHVIFVNGIYDYDENAAATGLLANVARVTVYSIGKSAMITNTDGTNGGAALTVTAQAVEFINFAISKGEAASLNSAAVRFNAAVNSRLHECTVIVQNAATALGVQFTGTSWGCGLTGRDVVNSAVAGTVPGNVGTAMDFDDAVRCFASNTGMGVTATGARFSANARWCSLGAGCLIQTVATGISLEAGATSNILLATILEADVQIRNLSGNGTNITSPNPGQVHADVTLDGSGDYDIFTLRGEVRVNHIYGIVTTATPAATTAANLQLFPAGGVAIQLTSLAGSDISNLPVGSVISKDQAAANAITVADSTNGAVIEAVGFIFAEFVVIQKTGGIVTTIRFNVTEAGASGVIHFEAHWEPLSDDGALEPV